MQTGRLVLRRVVGIALALLVGLPLIASESGAQGDANDDPARLRALAGRLLTPPNAAVGGRVPTSELLVGQVPPDLPLALPLPPGTQVIGSIVYRFDNQPAIWDVVLDIPGSLADVTNGYTRALMSQGWVPPPQVMRFPSGGFSFAQSTGFATLCQRDSGVNLSLSAYAITNGPNDVRVRVDSANRDGCAVFSAPAVQPGLRKLPDLSAPPGVAVEPGGGGGGLSQYTSMGIATTRMSAADLETAFAAQLRTAGWTRLDGAATTRFAWSTWQVPGDGDYQGFLYVLTQPTPDRHSLYLQAQSATVGYNPTTLPPPPPNPPPGETVIPGGGGLPPPPPPRDLATAVAMTVSAMPRSTPAVPVGPIAPVSTISFPPFGPNTPTPVLPTAVAVPRNPPAPIATPGG